MGIFLPHLIEMLLLLVAIVVVVVVITSLHVYSLPETLFFLFDIKKKTKKEGHLYIDECFKQQFSRTYETKIHIKKLAYRMLFLWTVPGGIKRTCLEFHISYFFFQLNSGINNLPKEIKVSLISRLSNNVYSSISQWWTAVLILRSKYEIKV